MERCRQCHQRRADCDFHAWRGGLQLQLAICCHCVADQQRAEHKRYKEKKKARYFDRTPRQ